MTLLFTSLFSATATPAPPEPAGLALDNQNLT